MLFKKTARHIACVAGVAGLLASTAAMAQSGAITLTTDDGAERGSEVRVSAPESYVVQPGDTLWSLSSRFLNNPWYWPKIWSYNPQLENPHWIYPGNVIKFYAGVEDAPVRIETEDEDAIPPALVAEPAVFEEAAGLPESLSKVPLPNSTRRRRQHFVSAEQIESAGVLRNSPQSHIMITQYDRVYLDMSASVTPGDRFQVFRVLRDVAHPVTGARVGSVIEVVGEVTIDALSTEQTVATVNAAYAPIERGAHVAALSTDFEKIQPRPYAGDVKAYVVNADPGEVASFGQHSLVAIDRGANDGLEVGSTLRIVRAGDPVTGDVAGLPDIEIGRVMLVDVRDGLSTGLILSSSTTIVSGDRVEATE